VHGLCGSKFTSLSHYKRKYSTREVWKLTDICQINMLSTCMSDSHHRRTTATDDPRSNCCARYEPCKSPQMVCSLREGVHPCHSATVHPSTQLRLLALRGTHSGKQTWRGTWERGTEQSSVDTCMDAYIAIKGKSVDALRSKRSSYIAKVVPGSGLGFRSRCYPSTATFQPSQLNGDSLHRCFIANL